MTRRTETCCPSPIPTEAASSTPTTPRRQVTQFINRDGQAIGYTYYANGLLESESFPDGTQDTFTYDSHDNLVSMTDSIGTTTFAYDSADRLTKVTYPDGNYLEYTYNSLGERIQMQDQTGFTVKYQYDALGRLASSPTATAISSSSTRMMRWGVVERAIRQRYGHRVYLRRRRQRALHRQSGPRGGPVELRLHV